MPTINLSGCLTTFITALSTYARSQLRQILMMAKTFLEIKLNTLNAFVGRNDVTAQFYKQTMDQIDNLLAPIEDGLSIMPVSDLSQCIEGNSLFGNIKQSYSDLKNIAQDYAFKYAQYTFASTYSNKLREELQNQLNQIDNVLNFLDSLATGELAVGNRVRLYETQQKGSIVAINYLASTVEVDVDDSAINVIVGSSSVGRITS